jgi:RND superfamily putative drug exporter
VSTSRHADLDGILQRLGRACARRRLTTIAAWILGLVAVLGLSGAFGGHFNNSFSIPGTPAQRAFDLVHDRFPEESGATATVVFHAERGTLTTPAARRRVAEAVALAKALPDVISVSDPYALGSLAPDRATAMATVTYGKPVGDLGRPAAEDLEDRVGEVASDGLRIAFSGSLVELTQSGGADNSVQIGLAAAVLVLLLAFGTVVAMGLPLIVALLGVAGGGAVVGLITLLMDVPVSAPQVATMIGLGVGIDYSVFVLSRHIENLDEGHEPVEAAGRALATSGHAVLVAGCTVVVALMGLLVVEIPLVTAIAVTAGATVIVMMLAALTLLPALLGLLGHRVTSLRIPGLRRAGADPGRSAFFDRWARHVTRRAALYLPAGLALLVLLAAPVLGMKLGPQDASSDPPGSTTREAYELISEGFGAGANDPLFLVAATAPGASTRTVVADVERALTQVRAAPDVAFVLPPKFAPDHRAALVTLIPKSGADSPATPALVRDLRDRVIPKAIAGTDLEVEVGGVGASWVDLDDRVGGRMAPFILTVVGIAFVLLMAVFRSPFLAAKAAVLNLLSIGAAYGVLVAVFQWGWGASLVGVDEAMPIVAFVPLMMFAILFGLSMDYEVFILSRIREEYLRSGDTTEAVARGLARTARLVTAAAAIMVSVFLAFVLVDDAVVKMVGLGLAVAVLVDATITRMILLPATMRLAGRANWWEPRWLARVLPPTGSTRGDDGRARPPRPAPRPGESA